MLAILLEMTWTLSSWAIMPVAAVWSARMDYISRFLIWNLGQLLDRAAALIVVLLEDAGDVGVGARHLDHARHLDDAAHVRLLERALDHANFLRHLRRDAVGRGKQARSVLLQLRDAVETHQPQLAARGIGLGVGALARRDGAVFVDGDVAVGILELDRTAFAQHLKAFAGDQLAGGVDLQGAVAGVALAARSLHDQEGVAVDRDVERIAGALDRTGPEIVPGCAVLHVAQPPVGALEPIVARVRHQEFFEHRAVGLVAGGVEIGDVVRDGLELAPKRDLPRQSDQEGVLHRSCSPCVTMALPSQAEPSSKAAGSPKRRLAGFLAEPVPTGKIQTQQLLGENPPGAPAGKFMLLRPPTRQNFPPFMAVEMIH